MCCPPFPKTKRHQWSRRLCLPEDGFSSLFAHWLGKEACRRGGPKSLKLLSDCFGAFLHTLYLNLFSCVFVFLLHLSERVIAGLFCTSLTSLIASRVWSCGGKPSSCSRKRWVRGEPTKVVCRKLDLCSVCSGRFPFPGYFLWVCLALCECCLCVCVCVCSFFILLFHFRFRCHFVLVFFVAFVRRTPYSTEVTKRASLWVWFVRSYSKEKKKRVS